MISDFIEATCILYYSLKPAWRVARRRWYVFRDSPDWIVKIWASEMTEEPENTVVNGLIHQARIEQKLRVHKILAKALSDEYTCTKDAYR